MTDTKNDPRRALKLTGRAIDRLDDALAASGYSYKAGATHNFYHYPARFSADIARAVIENFSAPGDVVLDPFMGGGTSIIEGLRLGRRMIGVDINSLAHFVASVRTTPLSTNDGVALRAWARDSARIFGGSYPPDAELPRIVNLPRAVELFLSGALQLSDGLEWPRQRAFARCALLRLGQWALDCRDFASLRRRRLALRLPDQVDEMLSGMEEFVQDCRTAGVSKNEISSRRLLFYRSAVGLEQESSIRDLGAKPRLVFTSPPYPSVHMLYHRWQFRGRKETPAPYWLARVPDGHYEKHYTGGSRTPTGQANYFAMIEAAFRSVRTLIHPNSLVVQLVGFSDTRTQLPRYLAAMRSAGFRESRGDDRLDRQVPNRKWYARMQGSLDASTELVLLHRPEK
jgi:hypothetical protein